MIRRALGDPADREFLQDALNYFLAYYRDHKLDNTHPYQGIKQALQQIGNGGRVPRNLAVLTNKPVRASQAILAGLGLAEHFFQIYGGNSFDTKKPDPFGANTLMREAGATADDTVMVGDSEVDILTARNAGLWSVGVTYGFAPQTLEQVPPDVLVDSPAELATALTIEPRAAPGRGANEVAGAGILVACRSPTHIRRFRMASPHSGMSRRCLRPS